VVGRQNADRPIADRPIPRTEGTIVMASAFWLSNSMNCNFGCVIARLIDR